MAEDPDESAADMAAAALALTTGMLAALMDKGALADVDVLGAVEAGIRSLVAQGLDRPGRRSAHATLKDLYRQVQAGMALRTPGESPSDSGWPRHGLPHPS